MKLIRIFTLAALFAALFFLVGVANADCPNNDPRCTILPPVSQEIGSSQSVGSLTSGEASSVTLIPLNQIVPMPLPPLATTHADEQVSPSFDVLALPLRRQDPSDPTCGVQALGMALDGLSGSAPSSNSLWNFLEKQRMTYSFGTGVEELAYAAQSFGYAGSLPFHNASLDDLRAELEAGRPVVVSLGSDPESTLKTGGDAQPGHFVTLTGISSDSSWVSYSDPILGKVVLSADVFMLLWVAQGNSGVRVAMEALATQEGDLNVAPWIAMAAGLMALVSTTPLVLRRKGIGGMIDPGGTSGGSTGDPPYPAPAGYKWKKKVITKYKTVWVQDGWSYENKAIPRYEKQRVQVGMTTVYDKIPRYKTIMVQDGWDLVEEVVPRMVQKKVQVGTVTVYDKIPQYKTVRVQDGWTTVSERVPQYKDVRYVKYYHTTRQKVKRYRYVRGRRTFAGYSYVTKRTPVYGTKKVFNGYKKVAKRVPNYVDKRVLDGYKVITTEVPKYEWHSVQEGWTITHKRVPHMVEKRVLDGWDVIEQEVPKYEWQDVQVGWTTEKVRVPVMVKVKEPDGVEAHWELYKLPDPLEEDPLLSVNEVGIEAVPDPGEARVMLTTNPLKIRSYAGLTGTVVCYAVEQAPIYYSGESKVVDGTIWYRVEYQDKYKGTVVGWVSSKYLGELPSPSEESTMGVSQTSSRLDDPAYQWLHLLSPEERVAYLAMEQQKYMRLLAEIERLIAASNRLFQFNIPLGYDAPAMTDWEQWKDQVSLLIAEPEWLRLGSMPPSFNSTFGFTEDQKKALQALLLDESYLMPSIGEATLEVLADAFGVGTADVLMQALESGPSYWHPGLSAGDLPLTLRVHDRDGVRLRVDPSEASALVQGPFNGIPYGQSVIWSGDYSVGFDGSGNRRVYYQVAFEWNGGTYHGWVPSEYFAPPLDKESGRPQSSGGYRRTYGYNQVDGWADYHAGGAAQNLNIRKIFEEMSYDFGDGENPFSTKHMNLCGQLAVMEALGVSLEEGFSKFAEMGELYLEILKDPKTGTNRLELSKLFDAFEKQVEGSSGRFVQLTSHIDEGRSVIALVSIDLENNGAVSETGTTTAHWVHVTEYGPEEVVFYNPYTNSEQNVSKEEFDKAWASPPDANQGFQFVSASP